VVFGDAPVCIFPPQNLLSKYSLTGRRKFMEKEEQKRMERMAKQRLQALISFLVVSFERPPQSTSRSLLMTPKLGEV
jgi:hypothetical protein